MLLIQDLASLRALLALVHHLVGLIIGVLTCIFMVTLISLGFGLLPVALIGLPILGAALRLADLLASAERARFGLVLGARIPAWPTESRPEYRWSIIPRWRTLASRATWGAVFYALLARPVVSAVALWCCLAAWAVGLGALSLPFYNSYLPAGGADINGLVLRGWPWMALSAIVGIVSVLAAPRIALGFAAMDTALTRGLLSPPADLAPRGTGLEDSRERGGRAAEAERRRIERDLHDGAHQLLVALAMELGWAKANLTDDADSTRELVERAHGQAKEALTELRNLVRGVRPPALVDRGLDAALSGLVALCPVPVDLEVEAPTRLKASVEAVAYFTVAEALTNVAKHSQASQAKVVVERHGYPGTLTIMISDDGVGGADPGGAGLTDLSARVSRVDGRLTVESPSGGPTIIAAELPCA